MNKKKTAFLILRVEEEFKKRIIQKAKDKDNTISEYIRGLLKDL